MFKKFYKMRNHYDRKRILKWLEFYPELKDEKFIVTEKLHGCCFGIQFTSDGGYSFQKKNSNLSLDDKFFNFQAILDDEKIMGFINEMVEYCKDESKNLTLFGELHGDGVQKEVKYCKERKVLFFDAYDRDTEEWITPEETLSLVGEDLYVPIIGYFDGLVDALAVDTEFNSILNPVDDNICEGVVLRPFSKNYIYMHDHLVVKKKNDKFKEKVKVKKNKEPEFLDPEIQELSDIVCSYVTDARLDNVISHIGEPDGMEDFGKTIKEFLLDIREDALAEHSEINNRSKQEVKKIFKASSSIAVNLLKRRIMGL